MKISWALSLNPSMILTCADPLGHVSPDVVMELAELCSSKQHLISSGSADALQMVVQQISDLPKLQTA